MAWPAAGPSTTMTSHSPLRSSCLILPSTTMSSMPGAAVATTSMTPDVESRRATRPKPCSRRYSSSAAGAEIASHGSSPDEVAEHRLAVELDDEHAASGGGGRIGRELPLPWSCRRPPCPPRSSRARRTARGTGSTDSGGTFAQTSDRPAQRRGRRCGLLAAGGGRRPRRAGPAAARARSTCCRSAGCSTRSWSRPSTMPSSSPSRTAPRPWSCRSTRVAPSSAATRWRLCWSASRRRRCRSPSGSGRPAPACTARRPSCSPWPTSRGWRPGRGSATPASR